jgi:hypothetical protein
LSHSACAISAWAVPSLDSSSLSEIELAPELSGLAVQCDPAFIPAKSISVYADDARECGLIEV